MPTDADLGVLSELRMSQNDKDVLIVTSIVFFCPDQKYKVQQ